MGKGFLGFDGLLGQDVGGLIMQACQKRNLSIRVDAVVNDSSATLLSRAYLDDATRLALILGTGMNAAIHLPVTALGPGKFGSRRESLSASATHVLVNTELSMFGKGVMTTTRWDDFLNATALLPDYQPFEQLVSGRYLGEIVRLVLVEAVQTAGLFGGHVPDGFLVPYSLDTPTIAIIAGDESANLSTSCTVVQTIHPTPTPPTQSDLLFVRHICRLVSRRAAAYMAAGVHALWSLRNTAEGLSSSTVGRISIGCNGSVMEKYPGFKERCQEYIDVLTGIPGGVVLEPALESAIFGAAIAVGCMGADC